MTLTYELSGPVPTVFSASTVTLWALALMMSYVGPVRVSEVASAGAPTRATTTPARRMTTLYDTKSFGEVGGPQVTVMVFDAFEDALTDVGADGGVGAV